MDATLRAKNAKTSEELIEVVAKELSPSILISFSRGKDSIAAWLACRGHFDRIVPFYLYTVPGLEFVEESLAYFERFFSTRILRYPQPHLYQQLNNLVYQPPQMIGVVERCGLPDYSRDEMQECAIEDSKLPRSAYTAVGVRVNDNMVRRMAFKKRGGLNSKRRTFWPVFDWSNERMRDEFRKAGVRLPVDYAMFSRTLDGIGLRYVGPIKKHYPRDYDRILEWFPLLDLELFRYEHQR